MKKILMVLMYTLFMKAILHAQCTDPGPIFVGSYPCSDLASLYADYHLWFDEEFAYPAALGLTGDNPAFGSAPAVAGTPNVVGNTFSENWGLITGSTATGFATFQIQNNDFEIFNPANVSLISPGVLRLTESPVSATYPCPGCVCASGTCSTGSVNYIGYNGGFISTPKAWAGYGIIEAYIRLPQSNYGESQGAFWLPPGPGSETEIDIPDVSSAHYLQAGVIDWENYPGTSNSSLYESHGPFPSFCTGVNDLSQAWHKYSCVWTPSSAAFYLDEEFLYQVNYDEVRTFPALNYLSFWNMVRNPSTLSGFCMDIKWVRVYEKNCDGPLSLPGSGLITFTLDEIFPTLYKNETITFSSPHLYRTMSNEGTIFEAEGTTINSNFVADESVLTHISAHGSTFISNGFFEILPIVCGDDNVNWFRKMDTSRNALKQNKNNPKNLSSGSLSAFTDSSSLNNSGLGNRLSDPISIQIYPNPTQNDVTIAYPCNAGGQLVIKISNATGQIMYTENVDCTEGSNVQQTVDMSLFSPGVYFVDLTMNDQHVVKKIVKL